MSVSPVETHSVRCISVDARGIMGWERMQQSKLSALANTAQSIFNETVQKSGLRPGRGIMQSGGAVAD